MIADMLRYTNTYATPLDTQTHLIISGICAQDTQTRPGVSGKEKKHFETKYSTLIAFRSIVNFALLSADSCP